MPSAKISLPRTISDVKSWINEGILLLPKNSELVVFIIPLEDVEQTSKNIARPEFT